MTDEELIARLRGKNCCESPSCNCDAAADRIEALVKQVDTMLTPEEAEKLVEMADPILSELLAVEAAYRKEAEAKVERLTGALKFYADPADYKAPFTGGMGKLWNDCGGTARANLLDQIIAEDWVHIPATTEEGHD